MNDGLLTALKRLRLSGLANSLDVRLQEAAGNALSHAEFLEVILQDELAIRRDRLITRRTKAAAFHDIKTLDDFDWRFNREAKDVLFIGPPGVGKSHLAQAIGLAAINMGFRVFYCSIFDLVRDFMRDETIGGEDRILTKYLKPDLLIVDDMGLRALPKRSGEYLFEIIMRRYENRSTIMTSNRPIEEWGKLVGDVPAATAILDRFLHHAQVVAITGRSYRLKDQACKQAKENV